MSEPGDADVRAVLARFGMSAAVAIPLGDAGGFSGARLWRVRADEAEFCLKTWPPGAMDPLRHAMIGQLLFSAALRGLAFCPQLRPTVNNRYHAEFGGRIWELADWKQGTADFHSNPSPERLRSACQAVACLHWVWAEFGSWLLPCPAVSRRTEAARDWLKLVQRGWRPEFMAADPVSASALRAWQLVVRRVPDVPRQLEPWLDVRVPIQLCVCDIWHAHVLFTGDDVSGLIDYGAINRDSVATDLARLLGSLVGDDATLCDVGLDAYAGIRPLSEQERQLVPLLDRTGVVLGLANWLRWLYHERRQYDDRAAVARRLAQLVERAERWA
jgi:Ser/Thr protein kinase RdoA (MazF antagonist)